MMSLMYDPLPLLVFYKLLGIACCVGWADPVDHH